MNLKSIKSNRQFIADFETTVFSNQTYTEVWSASIVEMNTENVEIFNSIDTFFEYLFGFNENITVYFHNLKFDGSFILSYLLRFTNFKQAFNIFDGEYEKIPTNKMKNNSFNYAITNLGQWYQIVIKVHNNYIFINDSLKLLPFSVERIGNSFKTKHKKLTMEYKGIRYSGCEITEEEQEYITNDVLVVKEALEIFNEQHSPKLTIGSTCLNEYKFIFGNNLFKRTFPNLSAIEIDRDIFKQTNADMFIRKSYKGGWCYLKPEKANKIIENGITLDVNSLYPSVMHSKSGNIYPYGIPTFWSGDYLPLECYREDTYYFIRIRTRFYLKENHLPTIQIKDDLMYVSNEWLTTSDVKDKNGNYHDTVIDFEGNEIEVKPELTLTQVDYELMKKHYNLVDTEIIGGCWFYATSCDILFDDYIDKYYEIKQNSKGAVRELAKLFLNNLYGKFATSENSSYKVAYLDNNVVKFHQQLDNSKKTVSIAIGSAITSYARNFTISHAQENYKDFIYADTDSIHTTALPENLKNIEIHNTDLLCWKIENKWDKGIFLRQKTYIEKGEELIIKCAGLGKRCKQLLEFSILQDTYTEEYKKEFLSNCNDEEKEFVKTKRELTDFKTGLIIPSKLLPKTIIGGIVLTDTTFEIRG